MQRATPAPVTALFSAAAVAVPGEKLLAVAKRDHALNVATTVVALMVKNALTARVWQAARRDIRQASHRVPATKNWKPTVLPAARRAASACRLLLVNPWGITPTGRKWFARRLLKSMSTACVAINAAAAEAPADRPAASAVRLPTAHIRQASSDSLEAHLQRTHGNTVIVAIMFPKQPLPADINVSSETAFWLAEAALETTNH